VEQFIAPEVLSGNPIDARTDVFSLGKLILWLYESSGIPFDLKKVVDKAISENPEDRFASIEDFRSAINRVRSLRNTVVTAGLATAIALVIVGLFFYLLPSPEAVEYVKPVEEPIPDEMVEEDLDALLGIGADADSATIAHVVELQRHKKDSLGVGEAKLREYNAKAEAIFRKQFTKAADAILSEVYNSSQMNSSEKEFAAKSRVMTEKLAKKQAELMKTTTLSADRANGIASKIIEQLMEKKKAQMDKDYMGIKNKQETEDKAPSTPPAENDN
jgi:serine/threonine protein kinase